MGIVSTQEITPTACDPQSEESLDALISLATKSADWTERDARYLVDKIGLLQDAGTWPQRLTGEPKTWERFCVEVLGYPARYITAIQSGVSVLEVEGVKRPTVAAALDASSRAIQFDSNSLPKHGSIGNGRSRVDNVNSTGGNDADYLTARIARDHPEIHGRMKAGEYKSVRAAALEAGIVKPTFTCPVDVERAACLIAKHFGRADRIELVRLLNEIEA